MKSPIRSACFSLLLLVGVAPACQPGVDFDLDFDLRPGTQGDLANAKFAFAQGCGTEFFSDGLCELNEPVLTDGRTEIAMWAVADGAPLLIATSSDESILQLQELAGTSPEQLSYAVTGISPGAAAIELHTIDGALFDRLAIEVANAETLTMKIAETRQVLLLGSHVSLEVVAQDRMGRRLHGTGVIEMETPSGFAPVSDYPAGLDRSFSGTDFFVFETTELGPTSVTATLDELRAFEELEVVDEESVVSIEFIGGQSDDGQATVLVAPKNGDGRFVYGAHCGWELDTNLPATLGLPFGDELQPRYLSDLEAAVVSTLQSGDATLRCTIASVTSEILITFP